MFDAQSNFIDLTANSLLGKTGLPILDPLSSSLTNLTSSLSAASVSYIVNTTSDVSNSTDNLLTLREVIEAANLNPGEDIIGFDLANGSTITLAGTELSITDDLIINGLGANNLTISGNDASRIFNISGSGTDVALNGLTLANGKTDSEEIDTQIPDVGIVNGGAGAILVGIGSTLALGDSTLRNNQSVGDGGAVFNLGTLTIDSSTLSNNSSQNFGGAIASYAAAVTIDNSTLSNNTAENDGGAIRTNGGIITINNSTLSNNSTSRSGGGIRNFRGTLLVSNSTFFGNSTGDLGGGGAISNRAGGGGNATATVTNSTFYGNSAGSQGGGGIENDTVNFVTATLNLSNSIVAGNTSLNSDRGREIYNDGVVNSSYNLFGYSSDSGLFGVTPNSTDIVPTVALNQILDTTLKDNGSPTQTLALVANSPAIDAGDPNYSGPLTTDQRGDGFDRIVNDRIDIGAFEVQRPPAEDVGTLGKSAITRTGSVNSGDPPDRYEFTLASATNSFRLTLGDLTANADVFILDSNRNVVTSSSNTGTKAEVINNLSLAAGTYYIEVQQVSGDTNYNLSFRR